MHRHLIPVLGILLMTATVDGQVAVEILNLPTEVYSLEPVYVLYSVENVGRTPLYLPAERAPGMGPGVYVGRHGAPPKPVVWVTADRVFPHARFTMWLAPGERWLFYQDIGPDVALLEGEATIQAVMSSDGDCGGEVRYGRQDFSRTSLRVRTFRTGAVRAEVYRCWQGEARSNVRTLYVRRSQAAVDVRAYRFLSESGRLKENEEQGYWWMTRASSLEERFPQSHYTYAQLARQSSAYSKKKAVDLQPDNPLNPWVMAAVAEAVIERRGDCSTDPPLRIEVDIEAQELPEGVSEYLEQHRWWVEYRRCPKQDRAPGGRDEE